MDSISTNKIDDSTYSNFDQIQTDNLYLKLSVDFN